MIKVLDKTFAILEWAVIQSPTPVRLSELAARFGINTATCSRIVRELTDAGYLEQVSRQAGYTAGPRSWTFASQVSYKQRLIATADPVIAEAAKKLSASVLLAELQGDERYILIHHNECPRLNIRLSRLSYRDIFVTATGLVLAAYAPESRQSELLELYRDELPTDPVFAERTLENLRHIREAGRFVSAKRSEEQGIAAFPVFRNGKMIAAVGGSVPIDDFTFEMREALEDELRRIARTLSLAVSQQETIS